MIQRAVGLALAIFFLSLGIASADNPPPLAEYQYAVDQALAFVDRALAEPDPTQRQALLTEAAAQLNSIHLAQGSSGERWAIDNDKLIADLNAAASDGQTTEELQSLAARLEVLRAAVASPPVAANEADRVKLRDILNQPPFKTNDVATPLDALLNQFLQWLSDLFGNTSARVVDLRNPIAILGSLLVLGLIAFFVRAVLGNLVAEKQLAASAGDVDLDSDAALLHAQRLAGQGDYRTAVRQLYLATLLLLDERGRLRYDRTLTNHEFLDAVKNDPRVLSTLAPIVATFDRTWYGFEEVAPEDFETYRRQVEAVKGL